MKINDALKIRQYKIILSDEVDELSMNELRHFGIWMHPSVKHYILVLKSNNLPIANPDVFEKEFRLKTGLSISDAKIEATYGPFNFQRAVDSTWF